MIHLYYIWWFSMATLNNMRVNHIKTPLNLMTWKKSQCNKMNQLCIIHTFIYFKCNQWHVSIGTNPVPEILRARGSRLSSSIKWVNTMQTLFLDIFLIWIPMLFHGLMELHQWHDNIELGCSWKLTNNHGDVVTIVGISITSNLGNLRNPYWNCNLQRFSSLCKWYWCPGKVDHFEEGDISAVFIMSC